jgi:hypothetical protein
MLGVVDKLIINVSSKHSLKINEFIDTKANNTLFVNLLLFFVESENTKCQHVDI